MLKYLETTKAQFCLLAETHIPAEGISKAKQEAKMRGWWAEFAPAIRTGKGRNHHTFECSQRFEQFLRQGSKSRQRFERAV